jgi:hypothetical protein
MRHTRITLMLCAALAGCGPVDLNDAGDGARSDGASADRATTNDSAVIEDSASVEDSAAIDDVRALDASEDSGSAAMDAGPDAARRDAATDAPRGDAARADAATDGGLMLTGLPSCMAANVTATQLYTGVVTTSCAGNRCHDPGNMGMLAMGSAAQMRTNLRMPSAFASMPRVTPGDIHQSYVVYKLLNQHMRVPGGRGNRMPPVAPLSNAQVCQFINWIRAGAM